MLGEFLEENCPDVSVQVVIKPNEDWAEYIDAVSFTSQVGSFYFIAVKTVTEIR